MNLLIFSRYVFKNFTSLVLLNVLILIIAGLIDSAAILSLAPVVDILIDPSLNHMSSITHRIVGVVDKVHLTTSVGSLLAVFVLFNAVKGFFLIFSNCYVLKTKYALLRSLILGTFSDFFNARWFFFSTNKQGTLLNTFLRETSVVGDAFGAMASFFAQILQCIVFIVVPFCISWQVSLISISCAVLVALPFTLLGNVSYRLGQRNTATANDIGAVIQESLQSAKIILGFGNQNKAIALLSTAFDAHRNVTIKSQTLREAIRQMYIPLGILVLAITIVTGRRFALPTAEIVVILYSFFKIIPLMADITSQKNTLDNFFPSYEQVMRLRDQALTLQQKTGKTAFSHLQHGVSLASISFSYPGGSPVLTDVTARIPKGKMIAFVGHSGAGKSTLVDTVMGFNEPTAGHIFVDDVPLQEFDVISYRQRIGYVPQESILFNTTIRDNLLWAQELATDDDIMSACCLANAHEFIREFPSGYDTLVGDRGVRLSGGQIQRIALARAILRDPEILILDEATSSLDSHSERLIQQSIEAIAKKTTIIAIAHRLSTIRSADYIYVLDRGRVAEEGSYAELMLRNGLFYQMVRMQLLDQVGIDSAIHDAGM